jgi:hypothetical protein
MRCSRRNPDGKLRRYQPEASIGRDFHDPARRIDDLVRTVGTFHDVESGWVDGQRIRVPVLCKAVIASRAVPLAEWVSDFGLLDSQVEGSGPDRDRAGKASPKGDADLPEPGQVRLDRTN